ncbi:MAG: hypothetical protein ACP5OX_02670 [Minisyncoccia bacterium]
MERLLYGAGILYAMEAIEKVGTDDLVKAIIVIVGWILYNIFNKKKKEQ